MSYHRLALSLLHRCALIALLVTVAGCHASPKRVAGAPVNLIPPQSNVPRELSKATLPPYTIEPPDILNIDAIRVVPKSPYNINTLDVLMVQAQGALPEAPIGGPFAVQPGGSINLGNPYGTVPVVGMTIEQAQNAISEHLKKFLRDPQVAVSLAELASKQQIAGQHLVGPDGTVTLGSYGSVFVTGMTVYQAKLAIQHHLSRFLEDPEVSLDVAGYNSKVYYIITQGAGLGDSVTRFPITGNETVLDAISNVNGTTAQSSKKVWIARPTVGCTQRQILNVDYCAVLGMGDASTNYQIMPGDRVFIAEDKMVATDNALAKFLAPFERIMGFTLLGASTINGINNVNTPNFGGGF
ncbi:MAG: polysaccharide biosynthesis/export family protein [Planctomycetota bacterium]|nr:polysaccharide biosynthesis/export family protein [Planctomycetota bacterium]